MKKYTFVMIFLLPMSMVVAQVTDFPPAFIFAKNKEYTTWLSSTGLSKFVQFNTAKTEGSKLTIILNTTSWDSLEMNYAKKYKASVYELLFDKMLFLYDVKPNEGYLEIDQKLYTVVVDHEGAEYHVEKLKKMGVVDKELQINFSDLSLPSAAQLKVKNNYSEVRKKLDVELRKYFKDFEPRIEKLKFESYELGPNKFNFDIQNSTGAILDKKYFEYIRVKFVCKAENDQLVIDYSIECKYAAGLIWAPKDIGWTDLEKDYPDAFKTFTEKFGSKLITILTDK